MSSSGWGGGPQGPWQQPQPGPPQGYGQGQWQQNPYGQRPPHPHPGQPPLPPKRGGSAGPIIGGVIGIVLLGAVVSAGYFVAAGKKAASARADSQASALAEEQEKKNQEEEKAQAAKKKERAELEGRVKAKMGAIDKVLGAKLPTASARRTVTVSQTKPVFYATQNEPTANGAAEPAEHTDLAARAGADPAYHSSNLHECAAFAKGKMPDVSDLTLSTCDKLRYFALLRTKRVEPKLIDGGKFIPGTCRGDALVFDLDSGKQVAAVPINGTNSDEVTQHLQDVSPEAYLKQNLDYGCAWAAQSEVNEAYAKK
ncbi:MAG: hypothetical protein HOV80_28125 [Polyangiaceae bacterium]|nr:hypothetical protein [Polyangiaceae bacterium]